MSTLARAAVVSLAALAATACSQGPALRGRVLAMEERVETAQKNGAIKCAPRELALAASHLRFATVSLDQGHLSDAVAHLEIAEPNARAAYDMSPADRCTTREFVEIAQKPKPGDRDGDGILDNADSCPSDPESYNGYLDEDGCPDDPDTDSDGIADSRDQCQLEPEDKDGYLDDDGCPDLDNDADGVNDTDDKNRTTGATCAMQPEDLDGYQDDDGCPDPDNDGDQVADLDDFCPNTPGFNGGDKPGCPKKLLNIVVTATEIKITQQIQFVTASWIISPPPAPSFKILDQVVEALKENPKITVEVQGHTDDVGPAAYNMSLSQQRADSVRRYLVAHGIDAARLTAKGYGLTQPLVPNDSAANRALNRRVQFIRTESKATNPSTGAPPSP